MYGPSGRGWCTTPTGAQYCFEAYQTWLRAAGLICSMTQGMDDCYQDALAERVNGILKDEFLFLLPQDLVEARLLVAQAVYLYSAKRSHLSLNYGTPIKSSRRQKAPPQNPSRALALSLSTLSRTGHNLCSS